MSTLDITNKYGEDTSMEVMEVLCLINQYCSQNMNTLKLHRFNGLQLGKVEPLLSHIKKLAIICCHSFRLSMPCLKNLETLHLVSCKDFSSDDFLNISFPKLKQIQLQEMDINNHTLDGIIALTPSLTTLSIIHCDEITSLIFNAVGRLQNLKIFKYRQHRRYHSQGFLSNLVHLTSLRKLEVLKLDCSGASVLRLFEGLAATEVALEHLELTDGPIDDDIINSVIKLKSLKILSLFEMAGLKEVYIMRISKELKLLEKMQIKSRSNISPFAMKRIVRDATRLKCFDIEVPKFIFDQETYQAILAEVMSRPDRIKIELAIHGSDSQLTVPKETLKGNNEKWLSVKAWKNSIIQSFGFEYEF